MAEQDKAQPAREQQGQGLAEFIKHITWMRDHASKRIEQTVDSPIGQRLAIPADSQLNAYIQGQRDTCTELLARWRELTRHAEASAQGDGWIKCSPESLPELEKLVLIATNEGGTFTGKYREFNGKRFWLPTGNATYAANWKVTHWRELPSPPKGDDSQ